MFTDAQENIASIKDETFETLLQRFLPQELGQIKENVRISNTETRPNQDRFEQALASTHRVNFIIKKTEKRMNKILDIALKEVGMETFVGKWRMELPYNLDIVSTWAMPNKAKVPFRLIVDSNKKWQGPIKECPLLKLMNMEMPLEWLDMPNTYLRKQINKQG